MLMRLIPVFKGFDFFPHDLNLPFMKVKGPALVLSIIAMIVSIGLIGIKGLNYGVDFKGGSLIELKTKSGNADISALREKLNSIGVGSVQIQEFGSPDDVLVRLEEQPGGEAEQQAALKKVVDATSETYVERRVEVVGPAVSSELRMTSFIAVAAGILAIVAYVWFRFEWQFALGAVLALSHDVIVTVGIFALFQFEFDLSTVAALLTILGYSVNDTVVVSDRIRENLRKFKKMELNQLLNLSINETLGRSLYTSSTAFLAMLPMAIWGGSAVESFAVPMVFGIFVAASSSVFIAAPILLFLGDWRRSRAKRSKETNNTPEEAAV